VPATEWGIAGPLQFMGTVDHFLALSNPALVSALPKKRSPT